MKTPEEIKQDLASKFPDVNIAIEGKNLVIPKENWYAIALALKTEYQFDYLSSISGADYKEYLEAVYHFYSISKKEGPLSVKVRTDRMETRISPTAADSLPSVTPIWRSAEFQEREAYDLFGIHFDGHPDLRRILMWDEFQFFPMRKDYVPENQDRSPEEL